MLGSSKSGGVDTKLLDNLILAERKLSSTLGHAHTASDASNLAASAWATPEGVESQQTTTILNRAFQTASSSLAQYATSVDAFASALERLIAKEAAVGEVARDRDILVARMVRLTKKKTKPGNEAQHLKSLSDVQQELSACEAVLASEQQALSLARKQTLKEHARARLSALAQATAATHQSAVEALQQLDGAEAAGATSLESVTPAVPAQSAIAAPSAGVVTGPVDEGAVPAVQYHEPAPAAVSESTPTRDLEPTSESTPAPEAAPAVLAAAPSAIAEATDPAPGTVEAAPVVPLETSEVQQGASEPLGETATGAPISDPREDELSGAPPEEQSAELPAQPAVPTASYEPTTEASPYETAEVGVVPSAEQDTFAPTAAPTAETADPAAAAAAAGPSAYQTPPTAPAEAYATPQEPADEGYSSSDPDVDVVAHEGSYAAQAAERTVEYQHQGAPAPAVDQKAISEAVAPSSVMSTKKEVAAPTEGSASVTSPAKSKKSKAPIVGPDGAVDEIGVADPNLRPSDLPQQEYQIVENKPPAPQAAGAAGAAPSAAPAATASASSAAPEPSSESTTSKLAKRLSLRKGNKSGDKEVKRSSSGGGGLLHRLNSVLLTDITAAADDDHHHSPSHVDEGKSGGLFRSLSTRSHKRGSGVNQSAGTTYAAGVILSDDEEEIPRAQPSGWKTRIDKHTRLQDDAPRAQRHSILSARKLIPGNDSDSDEATGGVYVHRNDTGGQWPTKDSIFGGAGQPFVQNPTDAPKPKRKSSKKSRVSVQAPPPAQPATQPAAETEPVLEGAGSSPISTDVQTPPTLGRDLHPHPTSRHSSVKRSTKHEAGPHEVYVPGDASDWVQAGKIDSIARAGSGSVRSTAASRKKALNGVSLPSEKNGPASWVQHPEGLTAGDAAARAGIVPRGEGEPTSESAAAEWKQAKKQYRRSVREKQAEKSVQAAAQPQAEAAPEPEAPTEPEQPPKQYLDVNALYSSPDGHPPPQPVIEQGGPPPNEHAAALAAPPGPAIPGSYDAGNPPSSLAAAVAALPGPVIPEQNQLTGAGLGNELDANGAPERKQSTKSTRSVRTKGSKKSRRTVDTTATTGSRPTGTGTGHTYEALVYPRGAGTAPTDTSSVLGLVPHHAAEPAPTGVPYQVTAPGSSLIPGAYPPSVPKAPTHSGEYQRVFAERSGHPALKGKSGGKKWSTRILGTPPQGSALGSRPGDSDTEDVPEYRRAQDEYDTASRAYNTARTQKSSEFTDVAERLLQAEPQH